MFLTEYLSDIAKVIDEYSKTGLITSSATDVDIRTEKIGLIKGEITFLNESKLFFTEYLDLRYKIDKLAYSFHYQDKDGNLIFRFDNASHKPRLDFKEHKHIRGDIIKSGIPQLWEVLEEIISGLLKTD
jgi:hypothetical protein